MDRHLKPQEAADFLGLSSSTLARLRIAGTGPNFRRFGRAVRYTHEDLRQWSEGQISREALRQHREPLEART